MFDFVRNLTKSAAERQQEALNAYLDDALTPRARQQFERLLAQDADLRLELEQRRVLKEQLRQLPRRRVPRHFTLDPARYGRPQRQPLFQFYPALRAATVLTAFFFILTVAANVFLAGLPGGAAAPEMLTVADEAAQEVALEEQAAEEPVGELSPAAPAAAVMEAVEVTRVVAETVVETVEEEAEIAAEGAPETEEFTADMEAPAGEPPAEEDVADTASDTSESSIAATPVPTPSPAATPQPLATATPSTIPRPPTETTVAERAVVAPTDDESSGADLAVATTIPLEQRQDEVQLMSGLRWLPIGLGLLFVVLATAVLYVRRQS